MGDIVRIDLDRLDNLFPTIYVTLISVLLGLALEDFLSKFGDADIADPWTWVVGISLLSFYVAVWTGYAFLAITQKRRPKLLDSVNVFLVSVGLFLLNDSIARPPAYFFFLVVVHYCASMYAVFYNVGMLRKVLPYETSFTDYQWPIITLIPHIVAFPIVGVLSLQGNLSSTGEILAAASTPISAVAWVWTFYVMWNRLLDRAKIPAN